jgi:hypothetical protein
MLEATGNEFPFVAALPKKEKGRVAQLLDQVAEFGELQRKHGGLIPVIVVAGLLNVHRSRVYQYIESGHFPAIGFQGHLYVPEPALIEFLKTERKNGRPFKAPSLKECLERVKELVKDSSK